MKMPIAIRRILLILTLSCLLSSCGTIYNNTVGLLESDTSTEEESLPPQVTDTPPVTSNTQQLKNTTTSVAVESGSPPQKTDDVEILWEIPQEEVESFVLQYGYSKDVLSEERKLAVGTIEKYQDPNYGAVYRYLLRGVPADTKLYVRLATLNDGEQSEFSEVFEVEPN